MTKQCSHCGDAFQGARPEARFCSRACKTAAANLEATRGKALYRLAVNWRLGARGGDKKVSSKALSDLTWLLDQYITEDRSKGVSPPPPGPTDMAIHHAYATRHKPAPRVTGNRERQLLDKVLGPNETEKLDA